MTGRSGPGKRPAAPFREPDTVTDAAVEAGRLLADLPDRWQRSHPIRGQEPDRTLVPVPASTRTDVVDTSKGTVHMAPQGR
ncbi:MAG: hypothetical protein ACXV0U_00495 [Kineosporiaceae bacterium]